ncbi:ABC transporter ATP-binding protein [Nigerium massiliense]|uniref:ABC transporter ATP-binding protein n=1 Tax=Nigerium massiliense TaxID=1522317 RepID=UPI000590F7B8|nr:ATP-binding cassette domain-containing protein [Nigerium massiliense]
MTLEARRVTAGYGGAPVLEDVSIAVEPSRIVGLQGPSGSGKSTLARVLAGLLAPAAGEVTLDGVPVEFRRGRLSGRTAMLFQSPRRSCSARRTLAQIIAEPLHAGRVRTTRAAVASLASEVGLTSDLLGRLPAQVSDGQLQRAALARALAQDPRYLICDEATAMLDPISAAVIARLVRARAEAGLGVLAISHDRALLEAWADEVTTLDARR